MNIFCAGGFNEDDDSLLESSKAFTNLLGAEIIKQGHTLINGCMTNFDKVVTKGALEEALKLNLNPIERIISYVPQTASPIHNHGNIRTSLIKDWELGSANLKIPEPIDIADVVICLGGFVGTQRAANWARIAKKPILPIVKFNGTSGEIYKDELHKFDSKYEGKITKAEYEDIGRRHISDEELVKYLLEIAERIKTSNSVFTVMSFADDPSLKDTLASFKSVCNLYKPPYNCIRLDDEKGIKRIFPQILKHIERSAFIFVDLTLERPNVYYELGYAEALEKPLIVTAKKGTEIHFDAKDIPIVFWESQEDLKNELKLRINEIAKNQGRDPVLP